MIKDWLHKHGLGKYAEVFAEHEIGLDVLPHLIETDLEKLGLPMGPRKRLLAAIATLGTAGVPAAAGAPQTRPEAPHAAERRQLTVLFCDLVGSTALSGRLDPEDLREVMRHYQDAVAGVVTRHNGYVANYMGDGVLAYFGWPRADEDQAAQAVRAGLAAIAAVQTVSTPVGQPLAARVGIATGQVVVGDLEGENARQAAAVSGETPNLAARLQALAASDTVVVGDETRRLLGHQFDLQPLGAQPLKGIGEPVAAWRVVGEAAIESRFAARGGALTRFIGRAHEVGLLLERWDRVRAGEGQVVLISGDAGIGKSRLLQELQERIGHAGCQRLRYQCAPQYANSAFYPVIRQLERAAAFEPDEDGDARLDRLEAMLGGTGEAAHLLAALLSLPFKPRYGPIDLAPELRKQRTVQVLVDQLLALAGRRPTLLLFEDAHWIDPSTEELLAETVPAIAAAPVLMMVTHRPEWQAPWSGQPAVTTLNMARLGRDQAAEIVQEIAGAHAGGDAIARIVARTDGIPLFVEELTKALVERGFDAAEADIPATLQASLAARLDRTGPEAKEVAQIGAAIGREFTHALLDAVAGRPKVGLVAAIDRLVESGLVFRTGSPPHARYTFKHALVQDTAYDSLLKRQRQALHLQIARNLQEVAPEIAATQPELLAHHHEEGGDASAALDLWVQAGELAAGRSAALEAAAHYRRALTLVTQSADGPERYRREVQLNLRLGNVLMQAHGFASPEVHRVWSDAHEAASRVGDMDSATMVSMAPVLLSRGHYVDAVEIASRLRVEDPELPPTTRVQVGALTGVAQLLLGRFRASWETIEQAIALDDVTPCLLDHPVAGADPAVILRSYGTWTLFALGYPERANRLIERLPEIVSRYTHAFTEVWAVLARLRVLTWQGRFAEVVEQATLLKEVAERHGFGARIGNALIHRGHALVALGEVERGLSELKEGLAIWESKGGIFHVSQWSADAAAAALRAGKLQDASELLARAERVMRETGELTAEADIHRIHGALAARAGDRAAAELCFRQALAVARQRGAMTSALSAATAMAELFAGTGRVAEATAILQPIYDWFTEGFDTPELIEAKALLEELAGSPASA